MRVHKNQHSQNVFSLSTCPCLAKRIKCNHHCLVQSSVLQKGMAALYPEPEDLEKFVRAQLYSTSYDEMIDVTYDWPPHDMKHGFPVPVTRRESMDD